MSRTLVMIDLETGGLNPAENGITEIAAVAFVLEGGRAREVAAYHTLVQPSNWYSYTPRALAMQGQSLETLERDGQTACVAMNGLREFLDKFVGGFYTRQGLIWGHNAPFDHGFLRALSIGLGFPYEFPARCDCGCTKSLFLALRGLGVHDSTLSSLGDVCKEFGVTFGGEQHTALADARAAIGCLASMTKAAGIVPA